MVFTSSSLLLKGTWGPTQADNGAKYGVTTGDVVKATIVGNVITAYKNGVPLARVTDNTYSTGNPGIGFNEGINGVYGISHFTATDAAIAAGPAADLANRK